MLKLTPNAVDHLRQMLQEQPDRTAFRVVFKGFG